MGNVVNLGQNHLQSMSKITYPHQNPPFSHQQLVISHHEFLARQAHASIDQASESDLGIRRVIGIICNLAFFAFFGVNGEYER